MKDREQLISEHGRRKAQKDIAWGTFIGTGGIVLATLADRIVHSRNDISLLTEAGILATSFILSWGLGNINNRRLRMIDQQLQAPKENPYMSDEARLLFGL